MVYSGLVNCVGAIITACDDNAVRMSTPQVDAGYYKKGDCRPVLTAQKACAVRASPQIWINRPVEIGEITS